MAKITEFKNRLATIEGPLPSHEMMLKNARVREGMSEITEITVEFFSSNRDTKIADIIGQPLTVKLDLREKGKFREFSGRCISVEYVGQMQGKPLFVAELRSPLWFLTRTRENRVFQDKKCTEIIMEILGDYGVSADVKQSLSQTYATRTYCVQYDETDYDFIMRLMAEEGMYFHHDDGGAAGKLVLVDDNGGHAQIAGESQLDFKNREPEYRRGDDHIFEWNEIGQLTTGKVMLVDFDFEKPNSEQKRVNVIKKGVHQHNDYEFYHYPTRSYGPEDGARFARVRMEAEAMKSEIMRGICNVRRMQVGFQFTMKDHPRKQMNKEYLVTRAVHYIEADSDYLPSESDALSIADSQIEIDSRFDDLYRCEFEVIPAAIQYRAPFNVPWPKIGGIQTAIVTGPDKEEINVDEFGRVKVKFHWDRSGIKDDKSSCWVRCSMPWTGKNWGMMAIPRVDQEVVIQFEDGNPDRPICTGMLYNADTKPPYALPENKTQSGIKTRSSKDGSADTFNELLFEDKKGEEFVRMQSEKDYVAIIKNNADITIGMEKGKDEDGSLTQTIYKNKTEILKEGDHSLNVEKGNQTIAVKKDHEETIEGKATQTITGDTLQVIEKGNLTRDVQAGNEDVTLGSGNYSLKAKSGTVSVDAAGAVTIESNASITLKVGGSTIKLDHSGVKINGTMVAVEASASVDVKGAIGTVDGGGLLTLKGGVILAN